MNIDHRGWIRTPLRGLWQHCQLLRRSAAYRDLQSLHARLGRWPRYQPFETVVRGQRWGGVDAASFLAAYDEIFVNDIYEFHPRTPTPLILDCGANVGLSVGYFLAKYPSARIIAFEPDPEVCACLRRNVAEMPAAGAVEIRQSAVYVHGDGVTFAQEGGDAGHISLAAQKAAIEVPSVRLRDLLQSPVDFLKLDIEGAEFDVLADCQDSLGNVDKCFVEMHGRVSEPSRFGEAIGWLEKAGFRIQVQVPFGQKRPYAPPVLQAGMDLQLNVYAQRSQ